MTCPECGRRFDTWRALSQHVNRGCPAALYQCFADGEDVAVLARRFRQSSQVVWQKIKSWRVQLEVGR